MKKFKEFVAEAAKKQSYRVYAPQAGKPEYVQVVHHTTHDLDEAKEHAKKLGEKHGHNRVHIDAGSKTHFIDTKTNKWTSLKN